MHRLDRRDDRDMRTHQFGERRDLASMIHADLEHGVLRARRAARQRQWHAPMIIVGSGRDMGLAVGREREPQGFLGSGLADRAGDSDHFGADARARSRKAPSTSGTINSGASVENFRRWLRPITAVPAPALSAAATKSWPSRLSPLMAKNASPLARPRLSIERPGTAFGSAPDFSAPVALAMSSMVHSAVMPTRP